MVLATFAADGNCFAQKFCYAAGIARVEQDAGHGRVTDHRLDEVDGGRVGDGLVLRRSTG